MKITNESHTQTIRTNSLTADKVYGFSPYVDENGNWWEFDDITRKFVKTGANIGDYKGYFNTIEELNLKYPSKIDNPEQRINWFVIVESNPIIMVWSVIDNQWKSLAAPSPVSPDKIIAKAADQTAKIGNFFLLTDISSSPLTTPECTPIRQSETYINRDGGLVVYGSELINPQTIPSLHRQVNQRVGRGEQTVVLKSDGWVSDISGQSFYQEFDSGAISVFANQAMVATLRTGTGAVEVNQIKEYQKIVLTKTGYQKFIFICFEKPTIDFIVRVARDHQNQAEE